MPDPDELDRSPLPHSHTHSGMGWALAGPEPHAHAHNHGDIAHTHMHTHRDTDNMPAMSEDSGKTKMPLDSGNSGPGGPLPGPHDDLPPALREAASQRTCGDPDCEIPDHQIGQRVENSGYDGPRYSCEHQASNYMPCPICGPDMYRSRVFEISKPVTGEDVLTSAISAFQSALLVPATTILATVARRLAEMRVVRADEIVVKRVDLEYLLAHVADEVHGNPGPEHWRLPLLQETLARLGTAVRTGEGRG